MVTAFKLIFLILVLLPNCFTKSKDGCKRSDPEFNKCIVNQMNGLRNTLKKGLPHLKIGSLDPMFVPKIRLKQGNGPVSLDLTSTDQVFRGIINYKIKTANIDLQNYKMNFTVSLPWLYVEGKTKMEGNILAFPIQGSGESWSNYTSVSGNAILKGHPNKKGGKEYFVLDNIKFDMSVEKATLHLNNLFNGNQELGNAMNKIMSDNWEIVFQELKPVIDQTVEELLQDIAVKVFNHYSIDDMFPK